VFNWIRDYNHHVSQSDDNSATFIHKVTAASSAAVYGDPDPALLPLRESAPYGGKSPYADTKYRMEGLMREFVAKQNESRGPKASAVALRFFNVFGPRQDPKNPYSGVISLFLEAALHDKDITVLGDGEMTRDFVYVKDVARAIVMSLLQETADDKATFDNFNVCTGKSITINTLAEQVRRVMNSSSQIKHLDPRDGDIRDSQCNPEKAAKGMEFTSAMPQEEGLEKTAMWFRDNQKLKRAET
jgi:nucleoside-diphosphate-sugar epimerase